MDHIYLNKVKTFIGIKYQIVREDGVILATTYVEHYANALLRALQPTLTKPMKTCSSYKGTKQLTSI